uniref:Cadherin domain-containing protein n=1 Tax=OCS116 cluster bacterium TaxID=2030921 RepID=A0A2A4Z8L6_9PROT
MSIQTSISSLTAYLNNKRIRKNQKAFILMSSAVALVASGDTGSTTIINGPNVQSNPPSTGDDIVVVGAGSTTPINTGSGNDIITGSDAADRINAGSGHDIIKAGKGNDIINGGKGDDKIEGGEGADLIRGGAGKDEILGGAGVDNIVIVGTNSNGKYTLSDLTNPNGTGIDLSELISLDDVNNNVQSDAVAGEIIDGGEDGAILFIYGKVDLTNVILKNITLIDIHSELTISVQQLNNLMTLGLDKITGDGNTILIIEGSGIVDLSGFDLSGIGQLTIGAGITIIADQDDINGMNAIHGMGTLKASTDTGLLVVTGITVSGDVTQLDSNGDVVSRPHDFTDANSFDINENLTAVHRFIATDPDDGDVAYSLSGVDAGKFTIDAATGEVSFLLPPDFEGETRSDSGDNAYEITINATTDTKITGHNVTVNILNVNDNAPIFATPSPVVNINEGITAAGTYTATDADLDLLMYSLDTGNDNALFTIDAVTGVLTFNTAPDYESPGDTDLNNSYIVNVIATDGTTTANLNLTLNVQDKDEFTGTAGDDNPLTGSALNDIIRGLAGNDTINALAGDDILNGGAGKDVLNGGEGTDLASYEDATSGVFVHTGWLSQNTGEAAGDSYTSIEGLIGSAFNDELIIVTSDAKLYGGAGNDKLTTVSTNSALYGQDGADELYANNGTDALYGGAGNDSLFGYGGNDKLEGGAGNDWLVGGSGNDTFVFKANSGRDGIADFKVHNGTINGDIIEIHDQSLLTSNFTALLANATESGGSTNINLDNGAVIELHNVSLNQLSVDDFIFIA